MKSHAHQSDIAQLLPSQEHQTIYQRASSNNQHAQQPSVIDMVQRALHKYKSAGVFKPQILTRVRPGEYVNKPIR